MNYGKAIKIIRTSKTLSQSGLAEKIGFNASYISKIESGERIPTLETIEKMCNELSIPVYLLTMLASEDKDLKSANEKLVSDAGMSLLKILTNNEHAKAKK